MQVLPKALSELIESLQIFSGVGGRTAERYALELFKKSSERSLELADKLTNLHKDIKVCPKTFALIDANKEFSDLYTNSKRNKKQVAVVEDSLDILAIDKTGKFSGTFHVLGGALSPIDGIGPEQLHISQLISRIKEDDVKEVIIATNASVEGESTALLIQREVKEEYDDKIKITRLARGIPAGTDIEYTDQLTLIRALEDRQAV